MANSKISALTSATTPLAGTETLPIVQSSTTKQVSVDNLTAGRAVSATSIKFGSGAVLSSYEEGIFTPTLIGTTTNPTVTYSLQRGIYTKVGRIVTVSVYMGWSALSGGSGNIAFGGLPFTIESTVGTNFAGSIALFDGFTLSAARTSVGLLGAAGTNYALPSCFGSAVSSQYITVGSVASSGLIQFTLTYSV